MVIDEALLMMAINQELDVAEADAEAEAWAEEAAIGSVPDFSGRMVGDSESDTSDGDGGGEDNGEEMLALLRGTIAALGGSDEEGGESDGIEEAADAGAGSEGDYAPSMPKELVRAFRRCSVTAPLI